MELIVILGNGLPEQKLVKDRVFTIMERKRKKQWHYNPFINTIVHSCKINQTSIYKQWSRQALEIGVVSRQEGISAACSAEAHQLFCERHWGMC